MKTPGNHCYTDPAENLVYESESCEDGQGRDIKNISNVGHAGVGPFFRKINDLLAFKNINNIDQSLILTDNTGIRTIDLGVQISTAVGNNLSLVGDGLYSSSSGSADPDPYDVAHETPTGAINGINNVYGLTYPIAHCQAIVVVLNGRMLTYQNDFFVVGDVLTLIVPPVAGDQLYVVYKRLDTLTLPKNPGVDVLTASATGSQTIYTLASAPSEADEVLVVIDGNIQEFTTDYSLVGTTLTFVTAPALGSSVYVYIDFFPSIPVKTVPVTEIATGDVDGANTVFTVNNSPVSADGVIAIIDGGVQVQGVDYTISGTEITFSSAPILGSIITIFYLIVDTSCSPYGKSSFEFVSKNLRDYNYDLSYDGGGNLSNIVYDIGAGSVVNKDFTYDGSGNLISITLSGSISQGINLTKSLSYDGGGDLINVTYS